MNDLDLLIRVATDHGANLKQVGKNYWACCPIHGEKTASFQIKETGKYKCHGCGSNGDALDLEMELSGCNFIQAKKNIGIYEHRPGQRPPKPRPPAPPKIFTSDDRRECYKVARYTLIKKLNCEITYLGKKYGNHEFIFNMLFYRHDFLDFLNKILADMGPEPSVFTELFIAAACVRFPVERIDSRTPDEIEHDLEHDEFLNQQYELMNKRWDFIFEGIL